MPPWRIPGAVAYRDALARGATQAYTAPRLEGGDLAFLQYTGGTTGRAKGAMLTQRNMVANTLQAAAWARPLFAPDAGVVVTPLPLYHVYSLTANLFCFVELGGHNLLITDPRDFKGFVALLRKHRFAFMTGVNTLFNALLHAPGFAALDFSSLRIVMGGGMAVQRDVATRWQAVTGAVIAQGYGLTEASPIVTGNPLHLTEFNGSVGVPFPSTDVAVFDEGEPRVGRRRDRRDLRARPASHGRLLAASRRDRESPVRRAAGCARATSAGSTRTGTCSSKTARKTSSSCRASRCIRTRSRTSRHCRRASAKQRRSACRTRSRAKS